MVLQYVVTRSGTTGDGCLRQRAEVLVERAGGDVHRIAERSKGVCPKEQNFRPQWYEYNLEADLRTTDWILEKVRADELYAQNLYAAMCNNDFIKREMWPILKDQKWSCSWRYAGGIVAHMRQEGDYIDWYCSGIRNDYDDEKENKLAGGRNYAPESVVTEEIENDLYKLGWLVVKDNNE